MGFKPIFEEERQFFLKQTGIEIPTDCWRNSSKIYLDFTQNKPLIQFKVADNQIHITTDNRNGYKVKNKINPLGKQKKISELIDEYSAHIDEMFDKAILNTVEFVSTHREHFYLISFSGGKDSLVLYKVWCEALKKLDFEPKWIVNFANTSNDTADTYRYVKNIIPKDKLNTLNPEVGFYTWIKDVKNYFLPNTRVRNCCSTYKEGQINKAYDNNRPTVNVIGVRKFESTKRANYEMVMDYDWRKEHFDNSNVPKAWINFSPIIDMTDEEIWLLILKNGWDFNRMYRLGFHRIGCLICPYQQDYVDLLIQEYYPKAWERWKNILRKNYDITCVKKNLKWSFDEWCSGRWKRALSKEYYIIGNKPTKERVRQLAKLKGISEDMAVKYFQKICSCGKRCSPTEIAMFYKTKGRFEGQEDNRVVLCKKCLCKNLGISENEYKQMATEYRDDGCSLF